MEISIQSSIKTSSDSHTIVLNAVSIHFTRAGSGVKRILAVNTTLPLDKTGVIEALSLVSIANGNFHKNSTYFEDGSSTL